MSIMLSTLACQCVPPCLHDAVPHPLMAAVPLKNPSPPNCYLQFRQEPFVYCLRPHSSPRSHSPQGPAPGFCLLNMIIFPGPGSLEPPLLATALAWMKFGLHVLPGCFRYAQLASFQYSKRNWGKEEPFLAFFFSSGFSDHPWLCGIY